MSLMQIRLTMPCRNLFAIHPALFYGEDAMTGENANEDKLVTSPVDGNWKMSLPASESDLEWVQAALKEKSTRITARDGNATNFL